MKLKNNISETIVSCGTPFRYEAHALRLSLLEAIEAIALIALFHGLPKIS